MADQNQEKVVYQYGAEKEEIGDQIVVEEKDAY